MSNLPATIEVPEIPVDTGDRMVSTAEAIEAMKRQGGLIVLSPHAITDLASVGISVCGVGVVKIQHGRAMVTQQRLDQMMVILGNAAENTLKEETTKKKRDKIKDLTMLAHEFGFLASKITESQKLTFEMAKISAQVPTVGEGARQPTRAFSPGQKVVPNGNQIIAENVHIHQGKK